MEESMKGKTRMWPGDLKMQITLLSGGKNKQCAHHYARPIQKKIGQADGSTEKNQGGHII